LAKIVNTSGAKGTQQCTGDPFTSAVQLNDETAIDLAKIIPRDAPNSSFHTPDDRGIVRDKPSTEVVQSQ
jgi:hypothetical protein